MLWMQVLHLISLYIQSLLTEKSSPLKQENIEFVSEILEKGTHILEMRKGANGESTSFLQSEPSNEWKIGYAFTVDPIDEKKSE